MAYIAQHVWGNTELTADIWNGRWNRHMWEDALRNVDQATKKSINPRACKKWLKYHH